MGRKEVEAEEQRRASLWSQLYNENGKGSRGDETNLGWGDQDQKKNISSLSF